MCAEYLGDRMMLHVVSIRQRGPMGIIMVPLVFEVVVSEL